ncbi:DUF4307 domain-containing protein [Nocardioides acrostichi]|uniref:DUF4307 domain-containing protein n=1 Tax=Nocardioides acrostichi TaxID=2784339 RepID=A0A930V3Y3_9ACTN|nr:DUF4307 domain-containing protein [Nocardioides acrostichi]MBF4163559.1 DUF4307 domain-containing protein [Nocardioides acrostichi]
MDARDAPGPTEGQAPVPGLASRYGTPPAWRGRVALAVVAVVIAALAALLGWAAWSTATPEVRSSLVGFEVVDDNTVDATVQVQLADRAAGVQCVLRAIAVDKSTVGEVTYAPDSSGTREIEIRTSRGATSVENVGCTADGQNRPR